MIDFKFDFREITIKVRSSHAQCNCMYFAITLARNNIFSFRKKILVAAILLYEKQQKSENRPRTPLPRHLTPLLNV